MSDDVTDPPDDPEDPDAGRTASADAAPYRARYHYTPSNGWMNDPNGLVYDDGTYHLFYQAGHDRRCWDHATSTDLVEWTEHGTEIPATETVQAYSGGAVVDENDTSGFGTDAIVCMYTGHHDDTGEEDQRLAYSTDGDTVTRYAGNPVLDEGVGDWRDPNPFWYEPTGNWRMVIARVHENGPGRPAGIEIYESDDLKEWTYLSTYESDGAGWECPDLYELPVSNTGERRWVLTVSVEWNHVEHHVGRFDGETFTVENVVTADHGRDFYAAQSWANEPATDDRLVLAWMSHWDYASDHHEDGWGSAQTFPRRVELKETGGEVVPIQTPDDALMDKRTGTLVDRRDEVVDADTDPLATTIEQPFYEVLTVVDPGTADAVVLKTNVDDNTGQETRLTYDTEEKELILDRTDSGAVFGGTEHDVAGHPLDTRDHGTIELRVLVDSRSITSIANDGEKTMTSRIFPAEASTGVELTASGGTATVESLRIYGHDEGAGGGSV